MLDSAYADFPVFDLGGGFFVIAVLEGSANLPHLDHNDDKDMMAWVVPLGNWVGKSYICLPRFNKKLDLEIGEVFAFYAARLLHFTTLPEGTRLVLTLFTDKFAIKHS